jgi:uncharacterized protein (TIGR03032 family)
MADEQAPTAARLEMREVRYEYTPNLPEILKGLGASLLVSTYQAGKLCVVGARDGKLTFAFHSFEQVMGVAASPARIAVGARRQIASFHPAHDCAARLEPAGTFDGCWVARTSFVTGNIHGHDLAWGQDGLWVVNTLFSCLCTLHESYNFVPRWRPPFVTELIDQDRCHLNGLAMENGVPRYVTVMAETNEPAGWRPTKATGGCVLDVPSGQVLARGLSMPHSPRLYDGRLWVLDSGRGQISVIERPNGRVQPVETVPGYTRGLAFAGPFAFVGLSRIRETSVFGGVPIAERRDELKCGVGVVDLRLGRTVATLQFHSGVEEIFAVEVLPGMTNPRLCGLTLDEAGQADRAREVWIVPSPTSASTVPTAPPPASTHRETHRHVLEPGPSRDVARSLAREAVVLHEHGRAPAALERLRRSAALDPASAEIQNSLGNLQQELGNQDAAGEFYRRAIEIDPSFTPAHQNLGYLLLNRGEAADALRHYETAQELQPHAVNRVLMATALPVVYESSDDVQHWRRRIEQSVSQLAAEGLKIDTTNTLVPTTFFLAYQGENDREILRQLGQICQGVDLVAGPRDRRPRAGGKIRVGFLSAYFRDHTIGRLNLGRIQHLSRTEFEVTVIAVGHACDFMADAFERAADRFVRVPRQVATARRTIADLGLDILVFADVGMDALAQSLAYSRMAPVQCATWGHPDTTGSPAVDFFLSSELLEDAAAQAHYTEQLVRLPNLGTYYERPRPTGVRPRESFGLDPRRRVYLCPQTMFKFHPDFDGALAGILAADPTGDVVVIEGRQANWTRRLRERWARTIPESSTRVRFLPAQPREDFLHLLAVADVIIDPFPFGGGNTSYEALAVGTPVVTWPGRYLRGRITQALYRKMGMADCIAGSLAEYVGLATRIGREAEYRHSLSRTIDTSAGVLFEDLAEVRSFGVCLRNLAG